MANLAINLLWALIGIIIFAGVIWLIIYGINNFIQPIPDKVQKGIWFIALLLALIYIITILAGGAPVFRFG